MNPLLLHEESRDHRTCSVMATNHQKNRNSPSAQSFGWEKVLLNQTSGKLARPAMIYSLHAFREKTYSRRAVSTLQAFESAAKTTSLSKHSSPGYTYSVLQDPFFTHRDNEEI